MAAAGVVAQANGPAHSSAGGNGRGDGAHSTGAGHMAHGSGHASHGGSHASIATDGAVNGHVIGTYLHGPVLARNPELADLLLGWALGRTLEPLGPGHAGNARTQGLVDAMPR
jgi:CobQ-like glutamine amidotransferase family enzyme